jgi:hypothetical protein
VHRPCSTALPLAECLSWGRDLQGSTRFRLDQQGKLGKPRKIQNAADKIFTLINEACSDSPNEKLDFNLVSSCRVAHARERSCVIHSDLVSAWAHLPLSDPPAGDGWTLSQRKETGDICSNSKRILAAM